MGVLNSKRLSYAAAGVLCAALLLLPYLAIYHSPEAFRFISQSTFTQHLNKIFGKSKNRFASNPGMFGFSVEEVRDLQGVLERASFRNKTVIITTLNEAWATQNSMIDLFLESFQVGEGTNVFVEHLVIVALDKVAYNRCTSVHKHCFVLRTSGVDFSGEKFFMTEDYLKMMWRRVDFLRVVLELGYNFVFSDADILWFRDPFPHFSPDADFEIACDQYNGNPNDLANSPNGGFVHVQSNNRTIKFYKLWYNSREEYPGKHDQDVLNEIKFSSNFMAIGLRTRFLSTEFFGGFCQVSQDLDMVCTMHANCCTGLFRKLQDLRLVIDDWKRYRSMTHLENQVERVSWRAPRECLHSFGG